MQNCEAQRTASKTDNISKIWPEKHSFPLSSFENIVNTQMVFSHVFSSNMQTCQLGQSVWELLLQLCEASLGLWPPVFRLLSWWHVMTHLLTNGLHPNSNGLQPSSDGIQPGFQPTSDGLQPTSDGIQPKRDRFQASSYVLQPNSNGNLVAMASNLVAIPPPP